MSILFLTSQYLPPLRADNTNSAKRAHVETLSTSSKSADAASYFSDPKSTIADGEKRKTNTNLSTWAARAWEVGVGFIGGQSKAWGETTVSTRKDGAAL